MQHGPGMHMGSMKKKLATFEIALKSKRQIAEGTYEFTFEKPEGLQFAAGQHIRMTLIDPPETDAEGDARFLTMASTPDEPDLCFAMRMRDTAFKRVLSNLQPGQKVTVQKLLGESPRGSFALHEDSTVPAVFVAGGIGIVPAYAMVKDATNRKLPHKLLLFYSNRRPEDAAYLDELQAIAKQNPNFTLVATMTKPEKSAQKWRSESGLINKVMLEKHIGNLQTPTYYVSGLPRMVSAMQQLLKDSGVSKDNIRAEEFTGFDLNQIDAQKRGSWTKYILYVVIAAAVLGMITLHAGGAKHLLTFDSPGVYAMIGLMLAVIIAVKLRLIINWRNGKKGHMTMMKLHKMDKKGQ